MLHHSWVWGKKAYMFLRPIQRKTDKKLDNYREIVGVDFQSYRVVSTYISIYLCRARCWDFRLKCVAYLAAFCSFSVRFVLNQIKNNFWAATSVELVSSDPVNPICSYNLFLLLFMVQMHKAKHKIGRWDFISAKQWSTLNL